VVEPHAYAVGESNGHLIEARCSPFHQRLAEVVLSTAPQ
jgi:hypothetical protein